VLRKAEEKKAVVRVSVEEGGFHWKGLKQQASKTASAAHSATRGAEAVAQAQEQSGGAAFSGNDLRDIIGSGLGAEALSRPDDTLLEQDSDREGRGSASDTARAEGSQVGTGAQGAEAEEDEEEPEDDEPSSAELQAALALAEDEEDRAAGAAAVAELEAATGADVLEENEAGTSIVADEVTAKNNGGAVRKGAKKTAKGKKAKTKGSHGRPSTPEIRDVEGEAEDKILAAAEAAARIGSSSHASGGAGEDEDADA